MKTLIALFAILGTIATASAQTYGSTTPVAGGTNLAPVQISPGVLFSNSLSANLPFKTMTIYGIGSTNEVVKATFGLKIPNTWQLMTGTTDTYIFGGWTNSFAAGTNGGTFTTNNFFFNQQFALPAWFNIDVGTNGAGAYNSNNIYMP